jgi:hypothetical protein
MKSMVMGWTSLREGIPEVEVIGVLRDGPGVLIRADMPATAENVERLEKAMLAAGATGWDWTYDKSGFKIRVYRKRRYWKILPFIFLALWAYDVHNYIAALAGRWTGTNWGRGSLFV